MSDESLASAPVTFPAIGTWAQFAYTIKRDRCFIEKYSTSALLERVELTRHFTSVVDGKTRHTWQEPIIHDLLVAGDYVWVLASDWFAVDNQKLALICLNKTTLLELDRVDLSPDEARERLWIAETDFLARGGAPQMWGGVTPEGAPWVNVVAWFTAPEGGSEESVIQEFGYSSPSITRAIKASNAFSDDTAQPSNDCALQNVAVSSQQLWLNHGLTLYARGD